MQDGGWWKQSPVVEAWIWGFGSSGSRTLTKKQLQDHQQRLKDPIDYPSWVPQVFRVLFTVTGYLSWHLPVYGDSYMDSCRLNCISRAEVTLEVVVHQVNQVNRGSLLYTLYSLRALPIYQVTTIVQMVDWTSRGDRKPQTKHLAGPYRSRRPRGEAGFGVAVFGVFFV